MPNPEWRLVDGIDGNVICKFTDEDRAIRWLDKQLKDYPRGYFFVRRAKIEHYPPLKEGQVDLFDLL